MSFLRNFLSNHVLANLAFGLILVLGILSYWQMPRSKDPEINFNWINILTFMPGGSAEDIERRITDPLEDALRSGVQDIRFVTSSSREGVSNILLRFEQIDDDVFRERLVDLRREIQNKYNSELPEEVDAPTIFEVTTSNAFPTASVVITGEGYDENLRQQARNIQKDLERLKGVDRVTAVGLYKPELRVEFDSTQLQGLGLNPTDLADTVSLYFRDISAGDIQVDQQQWLVRLIGTDADPGLLAKFPITASSGVVSLGSLAHISRSMEEADDTVRYQGKPAVMLAITKEADANVLDLVASIDDYLSERNTFRPMTGVELVLLDDQTTSTREAIQIMQLNAIIGLCMVLVVTWLFLGSRIALLTSIGIPFTLAGTFLALNTMGSTLNTNILLGVVIALGMLVDDAVVVVESIYYRLQRGANALDAAVNSLKEVFAPVTTSVLTTMAAFLPLMLLPGILGEFMKVIPMVVTLALAISLFEAYWMLPAHVVASRLDFSRPSRFQVVRTAFTHWIRIKYAKGLIRFLRKPWLSLIAVILLFALSLGAVTTGMIRLELFASDPLRLFYINIRMPQGTTLEKTIDTTLQIESQVRKHLLDGEARAVASYAGQMYTDMEPLFGDHYGQIFISLNPGSNLTRSVDDIIDTMSDSMQSLAGPVSIAVTRMSDGPPTGKPISIKVRGDEYETILAATERLKQILAKQPAITDISTDYSPASNELALRLNGEAIQRSGISPLVVARSIRLFVDGEIVTSLQDQGEKVEVHVVSDNPVMQDINGLMRQTLSLPNGRSIPLGELVTQEHRLGQSSIRHYNFRRAITVEAELKKEQLDTVAANDYVIKHWQQIAAEFPTIDLDFSGELDDIQESLDAIGMLFLLGIGLIYLILGTQFRSYWQPFLILTTVPMAFTGVVLGLLITKNPLSLFTLYGVVALAGISVNAAIVLISAANDRLAAGMSVLHAIVYAARRRVIPIMITSLTTIAGLFSLAAGLAGHSLIWGPVATAIVWGLAFSSLLALFVVPLLYRLSMRR